MRAGDAGPWSTPATVGAMPRQPTEMQRIRDQRDSKTLTDASWALRRLTDQRGGGAYRGSPPKALRRAAEPR
jgi:hypothetical protein